MRWLSALITSFTIVALMMTDITGAPPPEHRRTLLFGGGGVGFPESASLVGGAFVSLERGGFVLAHHGFTGRALLLEVSPGVGGGRIGIGYSNVGSVIEPGAKLVVLRTWQHSLFAPDYKTYVGPEVDFRTEGPCIRIGGGVLYQVSQPELG